MRNTRNRGQGRLLEVVLHRARKAAAGEYDAVKVSEVRNCVWTVIT